MAGEDYRKLWEIGKAVAGTSPFGRGRPKGGRGFEKDTMNVKPSPGASRRPLPEGEVPIFLLSRVSDRDTNHVTRDDHLDTAIPLPSSCIVVRCHRHGLSKTARGYGVYCDSLLYKKIPNRRSALFRQLLVEVVGTDTVGVTFHL